MPATTRLRRCAEMLLILLAGMALGCGQEHIAATDHSALPAIESESGTATDSGAETALAGPLAVPFPEPRESAALTEKTILAKYAEMRSPGAVEIGTALRLDARDSQLEYGVWRIHPAGGVFDSLAILLETAVTSEAWVGIADFETGRWEWHGPVKSGKVLPLDDLRYQSSTGEVWAAVVVHGGETAEVIELGVRKLKQNEPPVAVLNASSMKAEPGTVITLDASKSHDPDGDPLTVGWDFNNDGQFGNNTKEQEADGKLITSFQLSNMPGVYLITLRLSDNREHTIEESISLTALGWSQSLTRIEAPTSLSGTDPLQLVEFDNKPGVLIQSRAGQDEKVVFLKGQDINGSQWLTESVISGVLYISNIVFFDGLPCIVWSSRHAGVGFIRHIGDDWQHSSIDETANYGFVSLASIANNPGVIYTTSGWSGSPLRYGYPSDSINVTDWRTEQIAPSTATIAVFAEIINRPAVVYRNENYQLTWAIADDHRGMRWDYSSIAPFTTRPLLLGSASLQPMLLFGGTTPHFLLSESADGMLNWNSYTIPLNSDISIVSFSFLDGKPAAVFKTAIDDSTLMLSLARSQKVNGIGGWTVDDLTSVPWPEVRVGRHASSAIIAGRPAVAYTYDIYSPQPSNQLAYSVLYE